jgi:hypothetical protein
MPGLVPGIHVFALVTKQDVDGRDRPGHDKDQFYAIISGYCYLRRHYFKPDRAEITA